MNRVLAATALAAIFALVLGGCASREPDPFARSQPTAVPLDARLNAFATAHGARDFEGMRSFFATNARLQSPAMPRTGGPEDYIRAALAEPFNMQVSDTRILYADGKGARTRSRVRLFAPARFSIEERLDVQWTFQDGQWRIAEIEFPDWPAVVGTWRRAGLRGENAIELRIMPGGTYLIYADRDRSVPTFRGTWTYDSGALSMTDTSASVSSSLDRSAGTYAVIAGRSTSDFRLLADDHRWRSERFPGIWSAAR